MPERYVSPEITEWLDRLRTALPATVIASDSTELDRGELIDEIDRYFAPYLSTGPDYSRSIFDSVQDAVRRFEAGNGDMALQCLMRAHDALTALTR